MYAGFEAHEVKRALKRKEEPSYQGTFTSAQRYVLHTFATTQSALMKKRVSRFMVGAPDEVVGRHMERVLPPAVIEEVTALFWRYETALMANDDQRIEADSTMSRLLLATSY